MMFNDMGSLLAKIILDDGHEVEIKEYVGHTVYGSQEWRVTVIDKANDPAERFITISLTKVLLFLANRK